MLWAWQAAAITAPFTLIFLLAAHGALLLGTGSKEDPLGYGVVAVKN